MSEIQPQENSWKSQTYMTGAIIGAAFGFIAAYLFSRAAEEEAQRNGGKPDKVPTTQLIGVALAGLGLMRQISEMGKPKK